MAARCAPSRRTASRCKLKHGQGQGPEAGREGEARAWRQGRPEARTTAAAGESAAEEGRPQARGGAEAARTAAPGATRTACDLLPRESGARAQAEVRLPDRDAG